MGERHQWVLLVECRDMTELHVLRSVLQANGIPFAVEGEHAAGILGPIQGSVVLSRIMVPLPALREAREVAEDIVGPFAEQLPDEEDDEKGSPYRVPAPIEEDPSPAVPVRPRPKSYIAMVLIVMTGLSIFGLGHIYVGRNRLAGALAFTTLVSFALQMNGVWWAGGVPLLVWIIDAVGGAVGIAEHNERVRAMEEQQDDGDDEDDDNSSDDGDD